MDSKLITPESVDISQLLSGDVAKLPPRNEVLRNKVSIPKSPTTLEVPNGYVIFSSWFGFRLIGL